MDMNINKEDLFIVCKLSGESLQWEEVQSTMWQKKGLSAAHCASLQKEHCPLHIIYSETIFIFIF
jgi:hypothetical protein